MLRWGRHHFPGDRTHDRKKDPELRHPRRWPNDVGLSDEAKKETDLRFRYDFSSPDRHNRGVHPPPQGWEGNETDVGFTKAEFSSRRTIRFLEEGSGAYTSIFIVIRLSMRVRLNNFSSLPFMNMPISQQAVGSVYKLISG